METALLLLLLAGPGIWLALLLAPKSWANKHPKLAGTCAAEGAFGAAVAALASAVALMVGKGPLSLRVGGLAVFHLDAFSVAMLGLIAFLGWVLIRFSRNYLAGDPAQGRFFQWLGATLAAVAILVTTGNFAILLAAWIATSLGLHHLLLFYPNRAPAQLAARKKFLFSRAADLCLIGAAILLASAFRTLDIPAILEAARGFDPTQVPASIHGAVLLLAFGAILKSAQFPFHTWLPDTLETPTPVSALMHAGIISAGGFLLIRLSPVVALAPHVMAFLAIIGATTAIFGSLVMLTQTSVKKALAFSTVAQMGYMILQCGLGAFGMAALHLVAHSLYKAHAFLTSGSTVQETAPRPFALIGSVPKANGAALVLLLVISGSLTAGIGKLFGVSLAHEPGILVLGAVLAMAITTLSWLASAPKSHAQVRSLLGGVAICALYFALHAGVNQLLAAALPSALPVPSPILLAVVTLAFFGVFLLQANLAAIQQSAWGQHFYVLTVNRFYVNAFVNHLVTRFAPPQAAANK